MNATSAQAGRGWADLVTSAVDLACGAEELQPFLDEGRLPPAVLPNFLHEFAHFYCLRSPVGGVIASLFLEARDWILTLAEGTTREPPEELPAGTAPTAVRVDTAVRLLRPLLEGMALFAEHDLFPGKSAVASTLSFWTARLFLPLRDLPPGMDADSLDRITEKLLLSCRSMPAFAGSLSWARSKASLLLQPLALEEGGYLAGYLTVKNLWQIARHKAPALANTDLFFMYFYSLIFDDYGLVDVLLDDNTSEAERARRLSKRFEDRLKLLFDSSLEERVADYQAAVAGRQAGAIGLDGHYASIFLDEAFVEEQRERARKRQEQWLLRPHTAFGKSFLFGHACAALHRNLMRIGVIQVAVEVTDQGQVIAREGGFVRFSGQARQGVRPGAGNGLLAAYFDPQRMGRVVLCFRDSEVASEEFPAGCDSMEERAKVVYAIYKTITMEPHYAFWDGELEQRTGAAVAEDEWLRDAFPRMLGKFYESLAMGFAMPGCGMACAEAMRISGLKPLVEQPGLVTALALFGLLSSCRISYRDAAAVFPTHGLDLLDCERALNERAVRWGMPLVCPEPEKGSCFKADAAVASLV